MKAEELIRYFKSLGLTVHTGTKARGHQGFFLNNRIDISKNISENRLIPTLLHEFAHYIHSKLEPNMNKTGGSLEILFKSDNPIYKEELIKVTNFIIDISGVFIPKNENFIEKVDLKNKKMIVKNMEGLL